MTLEGDVVLVYTEGNPTFFARVESITPDVKRGWFQVQMLVLQVPLMVISWILREPYINGDEFTMGGRPIRLEKVVCPVEEDLLEAEPDGASEKKVDPPEPGEKGKVISLSDRRKKNQPS